MKKAAIFHTSVGTLALMQNLTKELMPDAEIMHIVEDSMIKDVMKNGGSTPNINARIAHYVESANLAGCQIFMTACSSIGGAVEACQFTSRIPVMRIDEAMTLEAIGTAKKLMVLATVETTLKPTLEFITRKARDAGKDIDIKSHLMADAFTAFLAGNLDKHDEIVSAGLRAAIEMKCDCIVLAQASMARVLEKMGTLPVPVLTSPERGIKDLKARLAKLA